MYHKTKYPPNRKVVMAAMRAEYKLEVEYNFERSLAMEYQLSDTRTSSHRIVFDFQTQSRLTNYRMTTRPHCKEAVGVYNFAKKLGPASVRSGS